MYSVKNFTDNPNINITDKKGAFSVLEYECDLSVTPYTAAREYFASKMNVRRRQLLCDLSQSSIVISAGAMQWMLGDVQATTGVKGVGDLAKKFAQGVVSKESIIKPEYVGTGIMVSEPTYKYLALIDVSEWNGSIVLDDGLFLAAETSLKHKIAVRKTPSSALAGNEGLFDLKLVGSGVCCLELPCAAEEIIEIDLQDDVVKIDGNMALAWSDSLKFTVERSGKTLVGSAASGEGLVNTYRGTGKVLMTPVAHTPEQLTNNTGKAMRETASAVLSCL